MLKPSEKQLETLRQIWRQKNGVWGVSVDPIEAAQV